MTMMIQLPNEGLWNTSLPGCKYFASIGGMWTKDQLINPTVDPDNAPSGSANELNLWMHQGFGVDNHVPISNYITNINNFPNSWKTNDFGANQTACLWHPRDIVIYHLQLNFEDPTFPLPKPPKSPKPYGVHGNHFITLKVKLGLRHGNTIEPRKSAYSVYVRDGDSPILLNHHTWYKESGEVQVGSAPAVLNDNGFINVTNTPDIVEELWSCKEYSLGCCPQIQYPEKLFYSLYVAVVTEPKFNNCNWNIEIAWVSVQF